MPGAHSSADTPFDILMVSATASPDGVNRVDRTSRVNRAKSYRLLPALRQAHPIVVYRAANSSL
jgi:hypothetical protein